MTNDDPFKSGSGSAQGLAQFEDQGILVIPLEYLPKVKTTNGEKDAIDADVVVFGPEGPEEVEGVRIFSMTLISAMKRQATYNAEHDMDPATGHPRMTLGVLFRDEASKRQGQNAPWKLGEPDDKLKALARDYLASRKREPADPFASA